MPVNPYFNHSNPSNVEAKLYEDLIIESIQIKGFDVYYIPRSIIEEDTIFNEEIESEFNSAYAIEVYLTEQDGFGDADLLAKFGLQVRDQATFQFSKRRWQELIQSNINDIDQDRPFEGDLLYDPISKKLFEIKYVEDEVPFYQLANLPVYETQCELFIYEGQSIDTGVEEIDNIENEYNNEVYAKVNVTSGDFELDEKITITLPDSTVITCELGDQYEVDYQMTFNLKAMTYPAGELIRIVAGSTLVGDTTGATATVVEEINIDDAYDYPEVDYSDNHPFEDEGNDFIDFTEDNPWGGI